MKEQELIEDGVLCRYCEQLIDGYDGGGHKRSCRECEETD